MNRITDDPQAFWQETWNLLLGAGRIEVPPFPLLSEERCSTLSVYRFLPVYIPAIVEDDYPSFFLKLMWDYRMDALMADRRSLVARWVAIEMIEKPSCHPDDIPGPGGIYPNDRLMLGVNHANRFGTPWIDLVREKGLLSRIALFMGFESVTLLTIEEWNLIANFAHHFRREYLFDFLPHYITQSYEWCLNSYGWDERLAIGCLGFGSIAGMTHQVASEGSVSIGFRLLVDLESHSIRSGK